MMRYLGVRAETGFIDSHGSSGAFVLFIQAES